MTIRLAIVLLCASLTRLSAADQQSDPFRTQVMPFLATNCNECHGREKQKDGVRLDTLKPDFTDVRNTELWTAVLDQVTSGEMPPKKVTKRPTAETTKSVTTWIATQVEAAEARRASATMRRLNRREYRASIRELLDVDLDLEVDIPADQLQHGFDTVGSALAISATHLRQYQVVARRAVERAITTSTEQPRRHVEWFARRYADAHEIAQAEKEISLAGFKRGFAGETERDQWLATEYRPRLLIPEDGLTGSGIFGSWRMHFDIHTPGIYEFSVRCGARPHPAMPGTPRITMSLDGRIILDRAVEEPLDRTGIYRVRIPLEAGHHEMNACNGLIAPAAQRVSQPHKLTLEQLDELQRKQPVLVIDYVQFDGPLYPTWPPPGHQQVFFKGAQGREDLTYAIEVITRFARRAWRRPVQAAELAPYTALVQRGLADGEPFVRAVGLAIQAILCSPDFLYLVEVGTPVGTTQQRRLSDLELATRLSYFLWSAPPDETLLTLAETAALRSNQTLARETARLLADPRSSALIDGFVAQWCELARIGSFDPDPTLYPTWDKTLELAMGHETRAFAREILARDLDVRNFLDADWTMLDERMARHYGIPGVTGDTFRRVDLPAGNRRGGLATQASMLMLTSDGIRSRPVHRGVWILRNLLGTPPRPPPPNASELPKIPGFDELSLRQQIEKHREVETCAACHARIDALGFALEHFDAIGAWREKERRPIGDFAEGKSREFAIVDASPWADGTQIAGPAGLRDVLLRNESQFRKALLTKLFIYAVGRTPDLAAERDLAAILQQFAEKPLGLRTLITAFISSPPFQRR